MLHVMFVLGVAVAGGMVGWALGWIIEEIEGALDARQQRRREHARLAIRQARAMREIDGITTAAVAELVRIAGEELSYA